MSIGPRASALIASEPKLQIPVLTRFLHANRYPPSDQVRRHASLENALASQNRTPADDPARLALDARRHLRRLVGGDRRGNDEALHQVAIEPAEHVHFGRQFG